MNHDIQLLTKIIPFLNQYKHLKYNNVTGHIRQSSVALIFRLRNNNTTTTSNNNASLFKYSPTLGNTKMNKDPMTSSSSSSNNAVQRLIEHLKTNFKGNSTTNTEFQLEMLLVKRAMNKLDLHSGQLAFPGGKCDNDESDYEAVSREISEEIGIKIEDNPNCIYLGKLPQNFFAYYRTNLAQYICVHVFLFCEELVLSLNSGEIDKAFWIPIKEIISIDEGLISWYRNPSSQFNIFAKDEKSFFGRLANIFLKDYKYLLVVQKKLNNDEIFYGLTFYMMMNFFQVARHIYPQYPDIEKNLNFWMNNIKNFEFHYDESSKMIRIKRLLMQNWYYYKRIRQFEKIKNPWLFNKKV